MEEQERERRRQVVEKFQKAPFEEIAAHCGARVQQIHCLVLECCHCSEFLKMLSLPGHTAAEQTQSDLWDYNQVINSTFRFRQLYNILYTSIEMMCAELTKLWTIQLSFHPGPHPAHLEPFHQVTVKPRVDPSPSTRWSFLISVCTRLQQNTPLDRNGIMQRGDGVHSWYSLFKHLESNNCTTKECQIYLRTSHFTSFVIWWQPKQAGLCKRAHLDTLFIFTLAMFC